MVQIAKRNVKINKEKKEPKPRQLKVFSLLYPVLQTVKGVPVASCCLIGYALVDQPFYLFSFSFFSADSSLQVNAGSATGVCQL